MLYRTGVRTGRGLCGRRVRRCTGVSLFPPASRDYVFLVLRDCDHLLVWRNRPGIFTLVLAVLIRTFL